MEIKIIRLSFPDVKIATRDIPKIRGYIANKYIEFDDLHNHKGNGFLYRYPLIQYKKVGKLPTILGIEHGSDVLSSIAMNLDEMCIEGETIKIFESSLSCKKYKFEETDELVKYKFVSPWMCLNSKNYNDYIQSNDQYKSKLLKKILIGNLLSMAKGFNYTVEKQLEAYVKLKPCNIKFKNKNMIGFKGEFLVNFKIPDYLGLGKSVSRGFGTVKSINNLGFK